MVDHDVLMEKINSIQNCLQRIHDTVKGNLNALNDLDVQDIVTLNLQRAIQLTVDIAFHIVANEKLGLPQNLKDAFSILLTHKIIDPSLAEKMKHMTGFRNIAVHDYQAIHIEILQSIVKSHLKDIEDFYSTITDRFAK